MITLPNGTRFSFVASSGALGLDGFDAGNGVVRLWKAPFRWLGLLRPDAFAVVTKTLTLEPRPGNLRTLTPWRCVRPLGGGNTVNAVGLTNPSLPEWIDRRYDFAGRIKRLIVSIAPNDAEEARQMVREMACRGVLAVAVELNLSCPNFGHSVEYAHLREIIRTAVDCSLYPVTVKLGVAEPYLAICKEFRNAVAAFDLINAVPWSLARASEPSPLARYGLTGGVSGPEITYHARRVLKEVRDAGVTTPIISGGGVFSREEAALRFRLGADAVAFGTLFLYEPWMPNAIAAAMEKEFANA